MSKPFFSMLATVVAAKAALAGPVNTALSPLRNLTQTGSAGDGWDYIAATNSGGYFGTAPAGITSTGLANGQDGYFEYSVPATWSSGDIPLLNLQLVNTLDSTANSAGEVGIYGTGGNYRLFTGGGGNGVPDVATSIAPSDIVRIGREGPRAYASITRGGVTTRIKTWTNAQSPKSGAAWAQLLFPNNTNGAKDVQFFAGTSGPNLIADGNSLTFGAGSTPGNTWIEQLARMAAFSLNGTVITNVGVNGQTWRMMNGLDGGSVTDVDNCYVTGRTNILICWETTNACWAMTGGRTAAQVVQDATDYIAARKAAAAAAGVTLIVILVGTIPREGGGGVATDADRIALSAVLDEADSIMASTWAAMGADVYVDPRQPGSPFAWRGYSKANFDATQSLWAESYPGRIHLTDAGYAVVTNLIGSALQQMAPTVTATGSQFLASASASYRVATSKIYLQSTTGSNVSSFTFLAKGSSAKLNLRNDVSSFPNAVRVSVDGGPLNIAPNVGSIYTLFSGLSDTWHRVTIQTGTAWGVDNLHLLPTGSALSVTGVDAAWVAPSYWLHPGDAGSLFHTTGALGANATDYLPASVLVPAVTNTSNVGTVRFRSAATKLFMYSNTNCLFYSRNGGAPVRVPVVANTGTVIEGLDGTEATYSVWSNGGRFVSVGTDAPLVDVGVKKRMDQFGDSITAADSIAGTADQNRGDSDVLGVAAALGFAGASYGISGQTIAQLKTNIVTQLAALPAAGPLDVAVLAIGRNDLTGDMDATEQSDYAAIIDLLVAKGYGRVLCRGVLPDSQVWTAFNNGISSVVTAKADPKVVYVNTNSWSGIATGDGTHPTIAGYATVRGYAIPAYTPHIPT